MGRIKSGMIKKAAVKFLDGSEEFSSDFEHNKRLLNDAMHYKSVRNKVAGEIVTLVKKRSQKKIAKEDGKDEGSE